MEAKNLKGECKAGGRTKSLFTVRNAIKVIEAGVTAYGGFLVACKLAEFVSKCFNGKGEN